MLILICKGSLFIGFVMFNIMLINIFCFFTTHITATSVIVSSFSLLAIACCLQKGFGKLSAVASHVLVSLAETLSISKSNVIDSKLSSVHMSSNCNRF